jgi:3-methyl-2-oxobutanoate hydroxymethyltransferase
MRTSINEIKEMKTQGEKIVMLTAYDYSTAKLVEGVGIPLILVGDSLGNVVLGYETPIPVTMDVMIHHTKAVVRGTSRALVVGDMPFMTYHVSVEDAMRNAARFIQEGGAQAVKLEGGIIVADKVKRIVACGIPVMGHLGLTPQSVNQLGGLKVQAKSLEAARQLIDDAIALEQAGAFSIVLEAVPHKLAALVTRKVGVPTIGIGAGPNCDGQVQIVNDVLGSFTDFVPKHAKQYAQLASIMSNALTEYYNEVREGTFPTEKHSFIIDDAVLEELEK